MKIILANPRGFCAGVDRAISIVELALEIHGAPIYVRHEVVHNRFVVNGLRERGAIFVEELSEVPDGAIVPSTSGCPLCPIKIAFVPLRLARATCICTLVTNGQVASNTFN